MTSIAVVIAHEIFGVNAHVHRVAEHLRRYQCDVFTPELLATPGESYGPSQQTEAYAAFNRGGGVTGMAQRLQDFAAPLREKYSQLAVLGFSVGATSAWLAASHRLFDAVVCCYGSRIRDYEQQDVACPVLLLFAAREPSFDPRELIGRLSTRQHVTALLYDAGHGFCDRDSAAHDDRAAADVMRRSTNFLRLAPRR